MRKTTTLTLLALVFTILVATTVQASSVKVPTLEKCERFFGGIGDACSSDDQCLGDAFCAESKCYPKQLFIGRSCSQHYECYRGLETDKKEIYAAYCDTTSENQKDHTCKFTKDIGASCTKDFECQSTRCIGGSCSLIANGTQCETISDCWPFDGELATCQSKQCVAKKANDETCFSSAECASGWCYASVCRPVDYLTEGKTCNTVYGDCAPNFHGSDDTLKCVDDTCQYRPRLRERYTTSLQCLTQYSEYDSLNNYGTCDKKSCYSDDHYNCNSNEFCDCTNNVCMRKTLGNMLNECDYDDGFRKPASTAFTRCLRENCANTINLGHAIMMNTESCAYKKCRSQYMSHVTCKRKAGKEYHAENIFYFGAGSVSYAKLVAEHSAASLSTTGSFLASLLVVLNIVYLLF